MSSILDFRSIHLCQRSFYKIFVKFKNNKKNVLNIVLNIVNINNDERYIMLPLVATLTSSSDSVNRGRSIIRVNAPV
jgi:hypothetical protein